MEKFEINTLIDVVKHLRISRNRIGNVNDDKYQNLTDAIEKIDEAIELIESEEKSEERFCECDYRIGEGKQAKCGNCGGTFKTD
jgi:hypothetical protein